MRIFRRFVIPQPAGAVGAVAGACARRAAFAANPPAVSVQLHQPAFFTLEADPVSCNPVGPDQGVEHGLAEGDHPAQLVRMDDDVALSRIRPGNGVNQFPGGIAVKITGKVDVQFMVVFIGGNFKIRAHAAPEVKNYNNY